MALLNKIGSVRYNVTQWAEAKKFWDETIGLSVVWASDEAGWAEYGDENDCHLAINRVNDRTQVAGGDCGVIAVFYVGDAFKAVEELRQKGVRCDDVQVVPGVVAFAVCYDPEGNVFQVAGIAPK